jgi:branched-chain amino acid transport system permease protein
VKRWPEPPSRPARSSRVSARGAVLFFLVESWFSEAGVWYLISIGMFALVASLYLPKGVWGLIEDRLHLQLLPIGYRLNSAGAVNARPAVESLVSTSDRTRA